MSKHAPIDHDDSDTEANWRNGHCTITYEDLEAKTGVSREVWDERIWAEMREADLLFVRVTSERDEMTTRDGRLHLPAEFENPEAFDRENHETTTEEGVLYCPRKGIADKWRFESPAVWPPGFRDVCTYCLHEFEQWWDAHQRNGKGR